nr:hypothetical transcript [Hymenolepis microstoma]
MHCDKASFLGFVFSPPPPHPPICLLFSLHQSIAWEETSEECLWLLITTNCQQSSTMINPVGKFDAEVFQTDIRELAKELPDLADDSSPIHGDIHNFLTEHSSTSTKRYKRHMRKTAKFTSADQQNLSQTVIQHGNPKRHLLLGVSQEDNMS